MKLHPSPFPIRNCWLPKPFGSGAYRHWLVERGSLTQRLKESCNRFSVERVRQRWAQPLPDEALLLKLRSHERALLREVALVCDGTQAVFAHSVLPRRSLKGAWHNLGGLGNKSLGSVLFANPNVARAPLAFRKLLPHHELYARAVEFSLEKPPCLWARRSVFTMRNTPILVTEVFLPGVLRR
ncbi:MAG: chorismate lyase [Methylobacillus sp.]|jgi:chorismate--pyruvate lyase|nr:chorismate lyase [Methylobacillus sp.]